MHRIGVVGAGVMGTGVAQSWSEHGHEVVLHDVSREALSRAAAEIRRYSRFGKLLGATSAHRADMADRVTYVTELEQLADVDFVIENITESWPMKCALYPRMDAVCSPKTVFAANTSAIPITRIAAVSGRPERVVGIHFMNPVPMKDTVELIKGWHTAQETVDIAEEALRSVNKEAIVVNDSPGFVSNRVLMLTINEAAYLLHEHVASVDDIDRIFRDCFGHKIGPLETADLIGLDTILYSIESLHESFHDSKYRPCPLLIKMVDAGLRGRKSGQGFYTYEH